MCKRIVPALMSCLVVLGLGACTGKPASGPAMEAASSPQQAGAAGPIAVAASPVNQQLDIQYDTTNSRYEAFPAKIVTGSTITWTFTSQFQVVFIKPAPCSNPDTPGGTTLTSSAAAPFQVVCNVNRDADRKKDRYTIDLYRSGVAPKDGVPDKKKKMPVLTTGDHCEGCIIDN